ncbi:MAG: oligoendopeptidase, partial [Heyndrickxia sp.]
MTTSTYSLTWDLDVFFKGGSNSSEFQTFLGEMKETLNSFNQQVSDWQPETVLNNPSNFISILESLQNSNQKLGQAGAFVSCLQAQDTEDTKANELRGSVATLRAQLSTILTNFDDKLTNISDEDWNHLLETEGINELAFVLNERRQKAKEKLSKEQEALINALSVDGYHGWGEMYDSLVSKVKIQFEENGETKELSVGQAHNKFSNPDREVRKDVFRKWEEAWD